MKTTNIRRNAGLAASAIALSVTLAACGDDATQTEPADTAETPAESEAPAEEPTESESAAEGAMAQTFGEACSAVPTSGPGSFDGMVQDPVATAASNNPLLGTLVTAVTEAGLVDTLNSAENITVFAPSNDAFAKVPAADLEALLADKDMLTGVLTYHVIAGEKLSGADLAESGMQTSVSEQELTFAMEGDALSINDGQATVVCADIPTANATVHIIDGVLAAPA